MHARIGGRLPRCDRYRATSRMCDADGRVERELGESGACESTRGRRGSMRGEHETIVAARALSGALCAAREHAIKAAQREGAELGAAAGRLMGRREREVSSKQICGDAPMTGDGLSG